MNGQGEHVPMFSLERLFLLVLSQFRRPSSQLAVLRPDAPHGLQAEVEAAVAVASRRDGTPMSAGSASLLHAGLLHWRVGGTGDGAGERRMRGGAAETVLLIAVPASTDGCVRVACPLILPSPPHPPCLRSSAPPLPSMHCTASCSPSAPPSRTSSCTATLSSARSRGACG